MAEVLIQGKVYRHDFGIAVLPQGWNTWVPAAGSLPVVATYGLSIDSKTRVLYAAIPGARCLGADILDKKWAALPYYASRGAVFQRL